MEILILTFLGSHLTHNIDIKVIVSNISCKWLTKKFQQTLRKHAYRAPSFFPFHWFLFWHWIDMEKENLSEFIFLEIFDLNKVWFILLKLIIFKPKHQNHIMTFFMFKNLRWRLMVSFKRIFSSYFTKYLNKFDIRYCWCDGLVGWYESYYPKEIDFILRNMKEICYFLKLQFYCKSSCVPNKYSWTIMDWLGLALPNKWADRCHWLVTVYVHPRNKTDHSNSTTLAT